MNDKTPQQKASEMAAVMIAFAHGDAIESRSIGSPKEEWDNCQIPSWDWYRFVYRIKPAADDDIPWSALNDRYQWAARDEDGTIYAFQGEPEINSAGKCWQDIGRSSLRLDHILKVAAGPKHWTKSKHKRPD